MTRVFFATLLVALPLAAGPLSPFVSSNIQITATAIDSSNNIYIGGTVAPGSFIPTTPGVYLPSPPVLAAKCNLDGCFENAFIAKISSNSIVIFATYFGTDPVGNFVTAIAVDSAGNIVCAVSGQSTQFIQKLAPDGSKLLGSYTMVGGGAGAIALSPSGEVFATGTAIPPQYCGGCQFVTTPGAFQGTSLGGYDAFAIHLDATLSKLIYSTLIGGTANDNGTGITVSAAGEAYITGSTFDLSSFPVTPGGYMHTPGAKFAPLVFAVKLNASGSGLIFSAQFNPSPSNNFGAGGTIATDDTGVYIMGLALSSAGSQFLTKLTPDGSTLLAQTLLPGRGGEILPPGFDMTIDASGDVLVLSNSLTLAPTTPDSFAPCAAAGAPATYVLQLNPDFSQITYGSYLPGGLAIRADGQVWYSDLTGTLNSFNIHDPLPRGIRCVADAFTGFSIGANAGPIAPGKLVNLKGPGIGSQVAATQQLDATGKVAVGLSGVNVYFNGIAAPLLSVSANQIEAVVPFENLDPVEFPTSTVVILNNGSEIDGPSVPVAAVAPALLTDPAGCISGFNFDGTLNSAANPAPTGSLVALFGEGAGQMNPAITGGIGNGQTRFLAPVSAAALVSGTNLNPGGFSTPVTITYVADTPGFVEGIFEINLLAPSPGFGQLQITIGNSVVGACVYVKGAN